MLDSLTLTTIILGELVFVLALVCTLLVIVLRRERKQQKRLLAAYQRLRKTIRTEQAQQTEQNDSQDRENADPITVYLTKTKDDARDRYRNITQTNLPRLAPEHPFNAKIAALRFLFCEAEERAYRKQKASGDAWVLMEKQLYDMARWIVDKQEDKPGRQRNNQVKLLQQRVEKLKGFEKLARDLQRKLELNQLKRDELERLQEENRVTIEKLQRINDALNLSQNDDGEGLRQQIRDVLHTEPTITPSERRLNNIEHFADDNQRLSSELAKGLRTYSGEYPDERSGHLEATLKRLEAELYRSERHINELKQQRRQSVDDQSSDAEASPQVAPQITPEARADAMDQIEETLRVIHTNMAENTQAINIASSGSGQSPYSLAEIQQLRHNNTRQRNLIVDLEGELRHLRDAIPQTENPEQRARQTDELIKLERLVKECEHCILALESEVDMLYNQLREGEQLAASNPEPSEPDVTLQQLHAELDAMTRRLQEALLNNERDAILSQFAQASLRVQSIEELARCIISALKRAQLIAGFYLESRLGHAEYYPSKHFSDKERALTRRTSISSNVAYLNEGILFASSHMHLLLKDPHADEQELAQTEQLLHALMDMTSARIHELEAEHRSHHQDRSLREWSNSAHNTLVNMEIRYAYQAEETLRLVDGLVNQVQRASAVLAGNDATKTVIDNAMSECQSRVHSLFTQDDSIEDGCNSLLTHLDHLPKLSN